VTNGILIIAHAPLASALRECVLHVFPDNAANVGALDVLAQMPPEESLKMAKLALASVVGTHKLVLTDLLGATPYNLAHKLVDGTASQLVTGVNLPMLVRAMTYRHESLEVMAQRAYVGGTRGIELQLRDAGNPGEVGGAGKIPVN
jgi:PTS system mannose-specific IIA component